MSDEARSRLTTEIVATNYGFEIAESKMKSIERLTQSAIAGTKVSSQTTMQQAAVIENTAKSMKLLSNATANSEIKLSSYHEQLKTGAISDINYANTIKKLSNENTKYSNKIAESQNKINEAAKATGMRYTPAFGEMADKESAKINKYNNAIEKNNKAQQDLTKTRQETIQGIAKENYIQDQYRRGIIGGFDDINRAKGIMSGQILTQETYNRKKAELNAMEQAFGPQKKYTTQLMQLEERRFRDITGAQKDATAQMAKYREQLDGMNQGHGRSYLGMLKWAAGWMIAYGALRAAMNVVASAWQNTLDYNKAIMEMAAVMGGTKEQADALGQSAFEMGKKFGVSAFEVLKGFQTWIRQGYTAKETTEAMNATLLLSNVAMMSTADAASALTAVLQEFHLTTSQLVEVSDKWIKLDMAFATTAADIANGFKIAGSTAYELGMNIDELNSLITVVASTTQRSGNQVATALRTMFTRTYREDTTKDLARLAEISTSTTAGLKPLTQIYQELASKWHILTKAQKEQISETISGVRQNNMFFAMMTNWNKVLHAHWLSVNASGDAFERNAKIMEAYQKRLDSMGPTWVAFKKSIGEAFAPNIIKALEQLTSAFERANEEGRKFALLTELGRAGMEDRTGFMLVGIDGYNKKLNIGYENLVKLNVANKEWLNNQLDLAQKLGVLSGVERNRIKTFEDLTIALVRANNRLLGIKDGSDKATKGMLAFKKMTQENYDAINLWSRSMDSTLILMDQLKDRVDINSKIYDINSAIKNRNTQALAANRREILESTNNLSGLYNKQKMFSDAATESNKLYEESLSHVPEVSRKFLIALTGIGGSGNEKLIEQYNKVKDILGPYVEEIRNAKTEEEQLFAMQRLLANSGKELAESIELQAKDAKELVSKTIDLNKQSLDYKKSLIDTGVEIDKNRLAIVKLADTIESSLINAIADVMEDFSKANETMNDFVNGLAKIANQSVAGGFYNMLGLNKFSRLAATGSVALNNPEDYRNFMETAGMNVGKTWRNEFVTGGDYIRQSIENGSKRGAEKYAGAGTASVTANNDVAMAAVGMAAIRLTAGVGGRERAGQNPYYTEDRSLMERYQDVMYSDASWYQKGMAYTGETIIEGAQEVGQAIGWGAKQVKKGFNWYSEQMSTATGRIIEQLGVMYLITRGNIDDFKNTKAGEFASIGSMLGALLGPGGSLIGALLGQQLGRYVKDPIAEQTETESQKLENINDTLKVSLAELEYVNRNLYAMRQTNDPYPVRDAWYFRPYTFGDGGFSKSGGMSWGKPNQYSNSGSGQSVTVGSISISVPSGDPQAIVNALSEAFSLQNIRVYQGA